MEILVLGASGGIGSAVVGQAVARGHRVSAVVRASSPWRSPRGVPVLTAEASDAAELTQALDEGLPEGGVVVSCLGLRRAALVPWAPLRSPPDLVETVTGHLLAAVAARPGIERVIWVSAGGVGDSIDACTWTIRRMIRAGNVGVAYADLERAEARVRADGDARWLAVRPVTLTRGAQTGRAGGVSRYGVLSLVSRADVASWILDVTEGTIAAEREAVLLGR